MTVARPVRAFGTDSTPCRPAGLKFRPIAEADLEFLEQLYACTREQELAAVPWPDTSKRLFLHQQFTLQHQHYRQHYAGADLLVIEEDDVPIGRVYLHRGAQEIRLMDIALIAQRRHQGLGTAIIGELLHEADTAHCAVTLHVEPNNPAQRLYASLGFVLCENRGVYDFLRREPRLLS